MRVFTATLGTETNSFSPIPTGWAAFRDAMLWRPGAHPDFPTEATGPLWAARRRAAEQGWQVVEGSCAFAMPGGRVAREVYTALRDEILAQLEAALPVDMVALGLHGAMMAHGIDDCEGDLLTHMRALVGREVAVGAVLDLHAHLSAAMVEQADLLVAFKEYPHTDFVERAEELLDGLARVRSGRVHPISSVFDCRMIASFPTDRPAVRALVDRAQALERAGEALSISFIHGFSLGDCADMGSKVLVVTDGDRARAEQLAAELGMAFFALHRSRPSVPGGVDAAIAEALRSSAPTILVDSADNPGGGNSGDDVEILGALRDGRLAPVCAGPLWDPVAVRLCFEAGAGARLALRIGGKTVPGSAPPLDVDAEIISLARDHHQTLGQARAPLGDAAAIRFDGIDLVLTTLRDQTYGLDLFTGLGLDPSTYRAILVKSSQQYRPAFDPIAGGIVPVARGVPIERRAYRHVTRPRWPFDTDPFGQGAP